MRGAAGAAGRERQLAGPRARDVLAAVTDADVSAQAFKFMDIRRMSVGMASAWVGRVSYTGDLGYEIWCEPHYQVHIFDQLMAAGNAFGIRLFGSRALNALRLEKSYGSWAREYRPLYGPEEAGLGRFVALDKQADFIGKEAALRERQSGGKMCLRTFIVDADSADVIGDEPIWLNDQVRGWVTSGGFAHGCAVSVAMGYVPRETAAEAGAWTIELLGKRYRARLQSGPLFDPQGTRMRE